jgi:hypothetical protein
MYRYSLEDYDESIILFHEEKFTSEEFRDMIYDVAPEAVMNYLITYYEKEENVICIEKTYGLHGNTISISLLSEAIVNSLITKYNFIKDDRSDIVEFYFRPDGYVDLSNETNGVLSELFHKYLKNTKYRIEVQKCSIE